MPSSRLGCPLSLKTPNMGNTGHICVYESIRSPCILKILGHTCFCVKGIYRPGDPRTIPPAKPTGLRSFVFPHRDLRIGGKLVEAGQKQKPATSYHNQEGNLSGASSAWWHDAGSNNQTVCSRGDVGDGQDTRMEHHVRAHLSRSFPVYGACVAEIGGALLRCYQVVKAKGDENG